MNLCFYIANGQIVAYSHLFYDLYGNANANIHIILFKLAYTNIIFKVYNVQDG